MNHFNPGGKHFTHQPKTVILKSYKISSIIPPIRFNSFKQHESNGMAEAFVKTFKRDYIIRHEPTDAISLMKRLAEWFEDYNDNAPHKGLKMMSPREFIRVANGG